MANFPASIVSLTDPSGTSLVSNGPDHAALHTTINAEVIAIETTIGTNSGTAILKNATAGKFAVMNTGGTLDQGVLGTPMVRGGTIGTATIGTSLIQGGTVNNAVVGSPSMTGGTYTGGLFNSGTFGTPTITGGSLAVSGTSIPLTIGGGLVPTVGTVTDTVAGTIIVNAQASNIYFCAMGTSAGNRTIGTPQNSTLGQSLTYAFKASGSANGTLVWQSIFRFSQDSGTPSLGTSTSWNYYSWRYNGIDSKYDFMGMSKNVI